MTASLTRQDLEMFERIPELDLVDLAVELEITVPETIDRAALIQQSIRAIIERAKNEGLPFSEYDREDLQVLSRIDLIALARLCGTESTVDALIKKGRKVYKVYNKSRARSQVPLLLPMLLPALLRQLLE